MGTSLSVLQLYLRDTGRYTATIDGLWGPATSAAILKGMQDGPETCLTTQDYLDSGGRLGCNPANVMAFAFVEASGAGFQDHEPKILFEPHIFFAQTRGIYSGNHPDISYPHWGMRPYPPDIESRYQQLIEAVGLDIDAGFASASYGKFQIMGTNHQACGYDNPWSFAFAQAVDEKTQLKCFEAFVRANGILGPLQNGNWAECAKRYNGAAYAQNQYDVKLATAANRFEQQLQGDGA